MSDYTPEPQPPQSPTSPSAQAPTSPSAPLPIQPDPDPISVESSAAQTDLSQSSTGHIVADLVPGVPPVPITVWRTARQDGPAGGIPARLAYRLVAAYSAPGQALIDVTAGHALRQVSVEGRRHHHPAWFTPTGRLIVGPVTTGDPDGAEGGTPLPAGEPPAISAWFGDDLTHPARPPAGAADPPAPASGRIIGATTLIAASWPLDALESTSRARLAGLLAGCTLLLAPAGCLVLIIDSTTGSSRPPEDFSPLVTAAGAAGLRYLQHLVAVEANIAGDAFVYQAAADEEPLSLAHTDPSGRPRPGAHTRIHADLLVFNQAQIPAQRRRPPRTVGDRHD